MELEEDADDVFEVDTITLVPKEKARKRLKTSENWKKVRAKRERVILTLKNHVPAFSD
ncbi:hypothetical protein J6590_062972 [Homalodisca vitripennis]|nr:hypothetical protein J6590_062972 [Homalodisca vitripennis]